MRKGIVASAAVVGIVIGLVVGLGLNYRASAEIQRESDMSALTVYQFENGDTCYQRRGQNDHINNLFCLR